MDSKYAVFFISTGRCGTQFFHINLAKHYGNLAFVNHEPCVKSYETRQYFIDYHKNNEIKLNPVLTKHIENIEGILKNKHYIETGWPSYSSLPAFIKHFKERIKIVHLYRHPVYVAASLVTHVVYSRKAWTDKYCLLPTDSGVLEKELSADWGKLSNFDKCLFWWTEINNYALDLKKEFKDVPWFSLKFEDVFQNPVSGKMKELSEFLGLPESQDFIESTNMKVDKMSKKLRFEFDLKNIKKYEKLENMMHKLGYSMEDAQESLILDRYYKN